MSGLPDHVALMERRAKRLRRAAQGRDHKRRTRAARRLAGVCLWCSHRATAGSLCEGCAERLAARNRARGRAA